ncbi:uncharacterized protein LOC121871491 isoform X1 [Homarus americanus]|uniref:uncharacterized protein LOC121871491 isoform X1 n=1 Tax=Homarus americanus TaxID=6706 RepID=UPI001C445E1D|nr:uncharacterized protein LOC121871491 isoform X1 [Homarus americanus]
MPTFLLLLLGLTAGCVRTQDSSEGIPAAVASPLKKAKAGPGDPCEDLCGPGTHTICDNKTKTCKCDKHHPVAIDNKFCVKPVQLGKPCVHHDQCQFHDVHAICREYAINYTECQCREKYEIKALQGQGFSQPNLCFPDLDSLKADVPTLLGLGLGMSVLSALICLVLKIFARARFVRPRRYADAHINPPLTVSGQLSREGERRVCTHAHGHKVYARRQSYPQRRASALVLQPPHCSSPQQRSSLQPLRVIPEHPGSPRSIPGRGVRSTPSLQQNPRETYAAFALAANASTSSSPARGRTHSLRSSTKSASSSRRPSYSSLQALRPGTRRSSQASLRLVVGEGRGEPIGYYVCIRDPASVHSRGGSRRPSQASVASSSGDLREGRVHHYLYMRAPNYSLTSETNTTTTGTSDSSPRTPKSTEQLLAVYHSVPEHSVLELGGVGSSHTTSTLGSSSDDVFKEEDEDEEEEEEEEEDEDQQQQEEEAKARLIV